MVDRYGPVQIKPRQERGESQGPRMSAGRQRQDHGRRCGGQTSPYNRECSGAAATAAPDPATLHSANLTATCLRAPVIHTTVTAWRKSYGQQQLSLERINATSWTHEQKVPWLPVLLGDLRVYRNFNMVLRNKSESVSNRKLYCPHHLAAFIKLISVIYVTKKKQAGSQLAPSSEEQQNR